MRDIVVSITIFFGFLGSVLPLGSQLSPGENGLAVVADESGTQVIYGRTEDAVIIGADSKISGNHPKKLIDGKRKLVAVGRRSACAIVGNLGYAEKGRDVSESIENWVGLHPDVEIPDAMNGVLAAAAHVWNGNRDRPTSRPRGAIITTLYCVSFNTSGPVMIAGDTYVGSDGNALISSPKPFSNLLGVSGVLDGPDIDPVIQTFGHFIGEDGNHQSRSLATKVRNDFEADTGLRALQNAKNRPSAWSSSDLQKIVSSIFRVVEANNSAEVAPPNNIFVIDQCNRVRTTTASQWPTPCSKSEKHDQVGPHHQLHP
jgi:hypothetical protein